MTWTLLDKKANLQAILGSGSAAGDRFGCSVAATSQYLAIGAPGIHSAYVYEGGTGAWVEAIKLTQANNFGVSVDVKGDLLVVGAHMYTGAKTNEGRVYVYKRVAGTWTLIQEIAAPVDTNLDHYGYFGRCVAMSDDASTLVVGRPGLLAHRYAYFFDWNAGTGQFDLNQATGLGPAKFGMSVAVNANGTRAVVGAPGDTSSRGKVYVYDKDPDWGASTTSFYPADGASSDYFGHRVGVRGDVIAASAPGEDDAGNAAGAVYIYQLVAGTWTQIAKLLPDHALHTSTNLGGYEELASAITMDWKFVFVDDSTLLVPSPYDAVGYPGVTAGSLRAFIASAGWGGTVAQYVLAPSPPSGNGFSGQCCVSSGKVIVAKLQGGIPGTATKGIVHEIDQFWPVAAPDPDTTAPTFVGVTGATASEGTITLTWDAATDAVTATDAIQYEVHVSTTPGDTWTTRAVVFAADVLPSGWETIEGPIECSFDLDYLAPGATYYVRVRARDAAGNVDTNTEEASAEIELVVDETTPTIGNISPTPGTPIRSSDTVSFDVTDDVELRHVEVRVSQGSTVETVFNGSVFVGRYTGSTRAVISGGQRFTVLRNGGWTSSPTFSVSAIDSSGNKA